MADAKIAAAEKAVRLSLSRRAFIYSGIVFLLGTSGIALESGVVNAVIGSEIVAKNDFLYGLAAGVTVVAGAGLFGFGLYHENQKHNK